MFRSRQAMDHLGIYKLSLLLVAGLSTKLVASQNDTRWTYICVSTTVTVACPERHLFNITDASVAYKAEFCPRNLTDPVDSVADCYEPFSGKGNFISNTRSRCNGSRSCDLVFDQTVLQMCATSSTANFLAVNYTCYNDPNPPTTTQLITTPNSTVPASPQLTTAASATEPFPYIIPIAVAAGATLGLILIICIIICCIWRNRGDTSIDRPDVRKESVTEVNIVKRGDDNRVKTAPRFKEDSNWNRPDLTSSTFDDNGQVENPSYRQGLYALPNKSAKAAVVTIETEEPQPPSHYETVSPENETSPGKPLIRQDYEKAKLSNEGSTYTNVAFTPDDVRDDEVSHDPDENSPPGGNRVRFAPDDEYTGRGSPDGGHSEQVTLREGLSEDRDKVISGMYAKVNKQGGQLKEDPM